MKKVFFIFCILVFHDGFAQGDCVLNAEDISNQIDLIDNQSNPFDCYPKVYADATTSPTRDNVAGNTNVACDPGPNFRDQWFTFTVTGTSKNVWISVYASGIDFTSALYSGSPSGTCGAAGNITGLTYIDCSDGISAGGARDVGAGTTPSQCRIDCSGLPPGTYFYRVWQYSTAPQALGPYSLCIETSSVVGVTSDLCPGQPTIALTCGVPNTNVNETYPNLSNAACIGNANNTNINEPQLPVGSASGQYQDCGAANWTIPLAYANNVINNTAIYAFEINATAPCVANPVITFDNMEYGGVPGNAAQIQVMDNLCEGGSVAVMTGTTDQPCWRMRPGSAVGVGGAYTLPNGTYYIVVDGQDGQLIKYDLTIEIDYLGSGCVPNTAQPTQPFAMGASRCGSGTVDLQASGCGSGVLNWYSDATGGSSLGTGTNFTTPIISVTTPFYVGCTVGNCESARTQVYASINTDSPDITDIPDFSECVGAVFPAITGVNLTGNEAFYSGTGGSGTQYLTGALIPNTGTYYMYDELSTACFDEEEVLITLTSGPTVDQASLSETCNGANSGYIVSFTAQGGNGGPYNVTEIAPGAIGGSFTGNTYTTNLIPSGTAYQLELDDGTTCPVATLSGSLNCNCVTSVGSMDQAEIAQCGNGTISALDGNQASTLDVNDIESYVLHEGSGAAIVSLADHQTTSSFNFGGTLVFGTTYFISKVAGDPGTGGLVDLNDPCLSVSVGTPVVWYEEIVSSISCVADICLGDPLSLDFVSTGTGPFNIVYNDGSGNQNVLGVGNNYSEALNPTGNTTYTLVSVTSTATGCSANTGIGDLTNVNVNDSPIADNINEICDPNGQFFRISFDIVNGVAPYTVNVTSPTGIGGTFSGNTWTSDLIPSGSNYSIDLSDDNSCGTDVISGQFSCICVTESGDMILMLIENCEDIATTANRDPFSFSNLDFNDVLGYVLHDEQSALLGNTISVQDNSTFSFNSSSMNYGVTYYISAIAGNNDGNGLVDLSDPCFDISEGTPVIWYQNPDAGTSSNGPVCSGEILTLQGVDNNSVPNVTYFWSGPNGMSSSLQNPELADVQTTFSGNYILTITNGICSSDETINVIVNQSATASFNAELLNSTSEPHLYQFNNTSSAANGYFWDFNDGETSVASDPTHQYELTSGSASVMLVAYGAGDCNDTIYIPVDLTVIPDNDTVLIFMPNTFTPDGNEFNQTFGPVFNESLDVTSFNMIVYNRWGEPVFQSQDHLVGWNGAYKSNASPGGIYTWVVTFVDKYTLKNYKYEGHVNLAR